MEANGGQTGDRHSNVKLTSTTTPHPTPPTESPTPTTTVVNNDMGIAGTQLAWDPDAGISTVCTNTASGALARHVSTFPQRKIVFGDNLNGGRVVILHSTFGRSLLDGGDVSIQLELTLTQQASRPMRLIDETNALHTFRYRGLWTQRGKFWPRLQLRWISMGWGEHHRRQATIWWRPEHYFPNSTMEATATTPSEGAVRHWWNLRPRQSITTWTTPTGW